MPDIDFQKIELNLIPKKGDEPVVFYASQYETARPFIAVLKWGDTEYAPGVDSYAEIDIRKNDDNLVVITDDVSIVNNEVSVILPVQAVTCIGKNLGQVKIYSSDDHLIAALNFILEVQADPLAGGITSETAIDNLESQIAAIVPEVIGDDYYNKLQTDALLNNKVDVSVLNANYYTKTVTDALLANKADKSELPDMDNYYDKDWIDDKFSTYLSWSGTQAYLNSNYYNQAQVDALIDNIFPNFTASGAIANFKTALNKPLVSVTHEAGATTITRCGKNFCDITDKTMSSAGYVIGAAPQFINGEQFYLPSGTYTFSFDINNATYPNACQIIVYGHGIEVTRQTRSNISQSGKITITFTANAEFNQMLLYCNSSTGGLFSNFQMEVGSTATAYEPYNGQTVPVADATTLTTLSGVNNVFADTGDVTVQYKYMSM